MAKLGVSIMAHQDRANHVAELVEKLGIGADRVTWDRHQNRWDTGRRAFLDYDPDCTHWLVLQDDALVCQDLLVGMEQALDHVPEKAIVSMFMGTRRPSAPKIEAAAKEATRKNASWLIFGPLNWGVSILVPTHTIKEMIKWCDKQRYPNYDKRIGQFFRRVLPWPTWHTWPNLVDHRDGGSLIGHSDGRVAHNFIGEDASALSVDWGGPVVNLSTPTALNTNYIRYGRSDNPKPTATELTNQRRENRKRQLREQYERRQELKRIRELRQARRQAGDPKSEPPPEPEPEPEPVSEPELELVPLLESFPDLDYVGSSWDVHDSS